MKNKLRQIRVEDTDFFWNVTPDKAAPERDYVFLRIWKVGLKRTPWITVRYHFHNPWLFYGELISAQTAKEKEKAYDFFQFKPLTSQNVAEIIKLSIELLSELCADKLYEKHVNLYLDNEGKLQLMQNESYSK